MQPHLVAGNLQPMDHRQRYRLSRRGLAVADGIAADGFV
jgi:hypothetical protein